MADVKKSGPNTLLAVLFFLTFILAIGSNFYHFFYTKNYNYLVEAACDPETENCFFRDCEESPNDCPPNGLSYYKEYMVKAYDFKNCSNNSCAQQCEDGVITCEINTCDQKNGDICTD